MATSTDPSHDPAPDHSLSPSAPDRLLARSAALSGFGAWQCDLATERLTWTDVVFDLFELPRGVAPRRREVVELYRERSRLEMELLRASAIRTGQPFELDVQVRTARGRARWLRLTAAVERADGRADGQPVRLYGAKQDITREREALEQMRRLADHDALTGLANRRAFDARLAAVAADLHGHDGVAALVLVDLDRFKPINDRLGHAAGDECLRQAARRLERVFPDARVVARIGGDEFAVLLPEPFDERRLAQRLRRAAAALARPVAWYDARIDLGASLGATLIAGAPIRPLSRIYDEADAALYAAKAAGCAGFRIFGRQAAPNAPSGGAPSGGAPGAWRDAG